MTTRSRHCFRGRLWRPWALLLAAAAMAAAPAETWAAAKSKTKSKTSAKSSKSSKSKSSGKSSRSSKSPKSSSARRSSGGASSSASSSSGEPSTVEGWLASLRKAEEQYGEQWTARVEDLRTGEVILDHNGSGRLVPASNRKITTYILGLDRMGPEFRFKTQLGITRTLGVKDGVLTATAMLWSNGDPALSERYLNQRNPASLVRGWIQYLADQGFKTIQGEFLVDASAFGAEQDVQPAAWEANHLNQTYAPRPSALAMNDNLLRVTIKPGGGVTLFPTGAGVAIRNQTRLVQGSGGGLDAQFEPGSGLSLVLTGSVGRSRAQDVATPQAHPVLAMAELVKDALKDAGIAVTGGVRIVTDPARSRRNEMTAVLGEHQSPPLAELMHVMMRESDNFIAEQTWRSAAHRTLGSGSPADARRVERDWLTRAGLAGVEPGYDGSGLSRMNKISAKEQIGVLRAIHGTPYGAYILDAMPHSGRNGTLRGRDMGAAPGRVRAKTGTLSGVGALSGFILDREGKPRWVFSLIGNARSNTNGRLTSRQNTIMKILIRMLDTGVPGAETSITGKERPHLRPEFTLTAKPPS